MGGRRDAERASGRRRGVRTGGARVACEPPRDGDCGRASSLSIVEGPPGVSLDLSATPPPRKVASARRTPSSSTSSCTARSAIENRQWFPLCREVCRVVSLMLISSLCPARGCFCRGGSCKLASSLRTMWLSGCCFLPGRRTECPKVPPLPGPR